MANPKRERFKLLKVATREARRTLVMPTPGRYVAVPVVYFLLVFVVWPLLVSVYCAWEFLVVVGVAFRWFFRGVWRWHLRNKRIEHGAYNLGRLRRPSGRSWFG